MARYKNGINGPMSGKVGSVIASSWKGIAYIKSISEVSSRPGTQAQLDARRIFAIVSSWLRPLKLLINIGFQGFAQGKTPMNDAISFTLKEAVGGTGANKEIDFARAVFSKGELLTSWIEEMVALENAVLQAVWKDALASAFCRDSDQAYFVVYNPLKEKFVTFENAALRADGEVILQLPADFSGDAVHCYQFYVDDKGDAVSTTQYLGVVLLG
jgi:hypothetical protein